MAQPELMSTYFVALLGTFVGRVRHDERGLGEVAAAIMVTGAALLGAAAVALILWQKLKGGAEGTNVPSPQAP